MRTVETLAFDGLRIAYDDRVLRPRPWTVLQGRWAAELLATAPTGPVLELGCGAGHIGLRAVHGTGRTLVAVDASAAACELTAANAAAAGLGAAVEVRWGEPDDVLARGERFALVVADPPWVPSAETRRHPEDPADAIDGGEDGLDVARAWAELVTDRLRPGGSLLLQLGTPEQAAALAAAEPGLVAVELRRGEGGVVVRLDPAGTSAG